MLRVVNGAEPPFRLCLQLAHSKPMAVAMTALSLLQPRCRIRNGRLCRGGMEPRAGNTHTSNSPPPFRDGRIARGKLSPCSGKDPKQAAKNLPLTACAVPNQSANWICLIRAHAGTGQRWQRSRHAPATAASAGAALSPMHGDRRQQIALTGPP